jgi:hypothetical protein
MVTFSMGQPGEHGEFGTPHIPVRQPEAVWNYSEAQKEFDQRLLTKYTPATVFVPYSSASRRQFLQSLSALGAGAVPPGMGDSDGFSDCGFSPKDVQAISRGNSLWLFPRLNK